MPEEDVDAGDAEACAVGEADPPIGRHIARQNRVPSRVARRHHNWRRRGRKALRNDPVRRVLRVQALRSNKWGNVRKTQHCDNSSGHGHIGSVNRVDELRSNVCCSVRNGVLMMSCQTTMERGMQQLCKLSHTLQSNRNLW